MNHNNNEYPHRGSPGGGLGGVLCENRGRGAHKLRASRPSIRKKLSTRATDDWWTFKVSWPRAASRTFEVEKCTSTLGIQFHTNRRTAFAARALQEKKDLALGLPFDTRSVFRLEYSSKHQNASCGPEILTFATSDWPVMSQTRDVVVGKNARPDRTLAFGSREQVRAAYGRAAAAGHR